MTTYRESGVDVALGDVCSKLMSGASDMTFGNRDNKDGAVCVLHKSGLHRIVTVSLGGFKLMLNSDGIGTKVEFAERTGRHETMAFDLFAMLCDDSVRYGAEPVAVSNILDVNSLDKNIIEQLASGMVDAAKTAGVAVVSGEIAELGSRISGSTGSSYNWGGTVMSVLREEITGEKIRPGDTIVALQEKGFRSNGISLVRKILQSEYGPDWHKKEPDGMKIAEMALEPSVIYTKTALNVFKYAKAITHVTGGGIPGKLGRTLHKKGWGAEIDNLFDPPLLMAHCQKIGMVKDSEAYKVWNMGQGMLVVTEHPDMIIDAATRNNIEAKAAGRITETAEIHIKSRGYFSKGELLSFKY